MIAALLFAALGFTSATAHRIDAIVASEFSSHRTPGIAVGVVEDGRIVYARGFGVANLSHRVPASPGTQFGIGQISEQFTAAAMLILEQQGRVKLDDPVTKYLPELTVASHVTVRELLDQTSGLPIVTASDHLFAKANAAQPVAAPGTAFEDNPLNYLAAAQIVERLSGEPLSDFVEQHIFVPLVMDASLYAGDTGLSPESAVGYTVEGSRFERAIPWSVTRLDGDAGVISDVYDLAKWDIEFPILLRVDAVRTMFSPGVPDAFEAHGMGWTLDQRSGRRFYWQNGEVPGFHAMNAVLPDDHVAVIVLANVDSLHGPAAVPESIAGRILDVVEPPSARRVDNSIVTRARQWVGFLATDRLDRTQLTPQFSRYLSDSMVRQMQIAPLGPLVSLVPISSATERHGDTDYEFLALFAHGERHFQFVLTPDGKIDFLSLMP